MISCRRIKRSSQLPIAAMILLVSCLGLPLATSAENSRELEICIDHFPTDHMFIEALESGQMRPSDGSQVFGFAIEAMKEVAERMNLTLVPTTNTPFKRCLSYMKHGQTDIMWGLLANAERAEAMHLFVYKGSFAKVLFVNRDSRLRIQDFEDLTGLSIGVVRGYSYFPSFDKEKELFTKHEVNTNLQGLRLLAAGRIDAFIMIEPDIVDYVHPYPQIAEAIRQSPYRYDREHPVHIALSKNSRHAERHEEMAAIINDMHQQGRFLNIRQAFNEWFYGSGQP